MYEYLSGNAEKVMKKGYPVGAFWSYSFAGLNHENGTPQFNLLEVSEDKPYNGDPTSFLVYSGTIEPYFTGGVNLNARYKSFTLSTMFSLRYFWEDVNAFPLLMKILEIRFFCLMKLRMFPKI